MSLFASLQNGVSGLNAASSGLNTTAHNLANTKTAGYTSSRQSRRICIIRLSKYQIMVL